MSVEGHANLKLACIEHTQNGNIKTYPSVRPQTMTSSTVAQRASPGDASNWVFNFDRKPKISWNTYATCLTSCLVKYTPVGNYAEWNGTCNWKFRLSSVSRFLEVCRYWISFYQKNCVWNIKIILTKFFRCGNLGYEIHDSSRKLKKRKLPDEQPLGTVVTYTCLLIHPEMQWDTNHRTKRSHIHNSQV